MKHFKQEEFACQCGCGLKSIDDKLGELLDLTRDELGLPITVTSGCRCTKHNRKVGGAHMSKHNPYNCDSGYTQAADITCSDLDKLFDIVTRLFNAVGDGRSKGFIHVDVRDEFRRWRY